MPRKKKSDRTKPAWDISQPGALPEPLAASVKKSRKLAAKQESEFEELAALDPEERLSRLDAMQEEAVSLANSRGSDLMTAEQQFIYTWQRELTVASGSLKVFTDEGNKVEDREDKIQGARRTLATALYKLGRIDEALRYAEPFADIRETITFIQTAKEYDDAEFQSHPCPREEAEQDGKVISLDRRWNSEEVISEIHGRLVKVWICTRCGLANAVPDTPERQARYDATMHATIHAAAKGDKPRVPGVARTLPQLEAGKLLVPND